MDVLALAIERLRRAGVHITEQEMDDVVARAISEMVGAPSARNPHHELMGADAAALESGGLMKDSGETPRR